MSARTDIYQSCGTILGQSRTVGPDGTDDVSLRINALYTFEGNKFLEGYPWNFAMTVEQLTASEPTPVDYAYGFNKPGKCRRIVRVDSQADMFGRTDIEFAVRQNRILTDSEVTWLKYVDGAYLDLEGSWPSHAVDALAHQIARKIMYTLDISSPRRAEIGQEARTAMSRAKLFDSQEEKTYTPPPSKWQQYRTSRVSGKNG